MRSRQRAWFVCGLLGLAFCSKPLLAQAPGPAPAPATASPADSLPANAAVLDTLLSQRNYLKLGQLFRENNKANEILLNMNWQKNRVLSGASAFVSFAYITDLDRIGTALGDVRGAELKKTAAMYWLYAYELVLLDGVKCKDVSAPSHRKDQLLTTFPNVVRSFPMFSDADMDTIVKTALKVEGFTAPKRADDEFICRGGLAEMQAALAKYGNEATHEVPTPPGRIGKTMEVKTDPDYRPEFVGKEVWGPKQAEIRTSMPQILEKLVAGVRKK